MDAEASGDHVTRRLMSAVLNALAALIGAALAVPAVGHVVSSAFRSRNEGWALLGNAGELPLDQPRLTHFAPPTAAGWLRDPLHRAVYVENRGAGNFTVFDVHCTHLGCPVQYVAAAGRFFSPCHGGVFDSEGRVLAGLPPRPLDRYEVKVEGGRGHIPHPHARPDRLVRRQTRVPVSR